MNKPIKVVIVDDSELIRVLLAEIFSSDPAIHVVGMATDAFDAREKIKELNPDVITLDVEMPGMDGITFLKNIMRLRPMPVVMISTLTEKNTATTLQAMELGAIDFIAKPKMDVQAELPVLARHICTTVKNAAKANISALNHNSQQRQFSKIIVPAASSKPNNRISIIAIGASTGGTEATKEVLSCLPENMPPIVVVQHMPESFTASYATRLNSLTELTVEELSKLSAPLQNNHVYIANGASHMLVRRRNDKAIALRSDEQPVNRHKPSVDVLFNSIAENYGSDAISIILTGMGIDGVSGMAKMKNAGAETIAQDEKSSVVWGMPRVASERGAANKIMPLSEIGQFLVNKCYT
jgi:two-component system chemotaxis response regulator CheB